MGEHVIDVDPVGARSRAEFLALLRRRREVAGLSYRQLERRARQDGGSLPPSTVATMLQRSTLPARELIAEYVRACGGDGAEVAGWLAARDRLAAAVEAAPLPAGAPSLPVPPRQLPPAPVGLAGRRAELAELDVAAAESGLVVVTGAPGVGKTAVAVEWAHRAANRFPAGQLHLTAPATAGEALTHVLVGLGVPARAVPADERHAAALFRSLVADQRILLVLDGAVSADQVRLLRAGGPGSCTLVTSRDSLVGLSVYDGGRVVVVPPLDRGHAVRVLARAAGERVVAAELTAAARLADLCEGTPLALRIAAAALDRTAGTPIADLVARMDAAGPLAELGADGDPQLDLSAVYEPEYDRLDEPARRVFLLLGALPTATPQALAVVTGAPVPRVRSALRQLTDRHLATHLGGDRFTMPGLLREYARLRAEPVERRDSTAA
ncbi:NB-ARC domain-containing protein [Actinosynnema sp. CS-041913]|uniref:NB-ARC domain-containing protein n=1 Tax=Actinosynnema sp. CS-041913 TaxID=3239917 RepID=UPI003D943926